MRIDIIEKCGHSGKSQFSRCSVALVSKCMTKRVRFTLSFIDLFL